MQGPAGTRFVSHVNYYFVDGGNTWSSLTSRKDKDRAKDEEGGAKGMGPVPLVRSMSRSLNSLEGCCGAPDAWGAKSAGNL